MKEREAQEYVEKRRRAFVKRHGINLFIAIRRVHAVQTEWSVRFLADQDDEMSKIEAIQHRLVNRATKVGITKMTTDELEDYLDVEELWWFLTSGKTEDFVSGGFGAAMMVIMTELHARKFDFTKVRDGSK